MYLALLISWDLLDLPVYVSFFWGVFLTVAICCAHVTQHVLLHNLICVGARTKGAYCPLSFLKYFCPADFNDLISPMIFLQLKTHPSCDNTPLSIRRTETQTQRVHCKDTWITNMDMYQAQGLTVGPVAFHSLFNYAKSTTFGPTLITPSWLCQRPMSLKWE